MKIVFNPKTCHLRRDVISRHVAKHRHATTDIQHKLAEHPGIGIDEFHKRFNNLEKKHKHLIAKITLHEATKDSN